MKDIAIVTGYPRSMTGWLSVLLTQKGQCFATHEGLAIILSDGGCWGKFVESRPEPLVIDCSSAYLIDGVRRDVRTVLITADQRSRMSAHIKALEPHLDKSSVNRLDQAWAAMQDNYHQLLTDPDVYKIALEDIHDEEQCRKMVQWVSPAHEWDSARYHQLRRLIIIQNIPLIIKQLGLALDGSEV